MIDLNLSYGGKFRAWDYSIEDVKVFSHKKVCKQYHISCNEHKKIEKNESKRTAIAEIFLPRGGRNIYGLLGVEYLKEDSDEINVSIPIETDAKRKFNQAIFSNFDIVHVGIDEEYVEFIIKSIDQIYNSHQLNLSGQLIFNYQASSEVSSNGWIFQRLTNILIQVLRTDETEISQFFIEEHLK